MTIEILTAVNTIILLVRRLLLVHKKRTPDGTGAIEGSIGMPTGANCHLEA